MLKAIVLSGGGSKGAYQIGVWKALRKLNYKYDIVTGTSIGSVNGMLMVQNEYKKAVKLWKNIGFTDVFGDAVDKKSTKEIYKIYAKSFFTSGGMDTSSFMTLLKRVYNPKKFNRSKIDFGLMTYKLSQKKSEVIIKKNLNNNLLDYILASCTCYPIFKITDIEGEKYIDGGYYDNLPINLAISLGAEEIIAVDMKTLGIRRRVKNKSVNIRYIYPRNDLGPSMFFDKELSEKCLKYGYNDTLKEMGELDGDKYTFKKGNILANYNKLSEKYVNQIENLYNSVNTKEKYKTKLLKEDLYLILGGIAEYMGNLLKLDDSRIYRIRNFNRKIKKKFEKIISAEMKLNKILDKKLLIKYIYDKLVSQKYTNRDIILYTNLFRKELLSAIYLMII